MCLPRRRLFIPALGVVIQRIAFFLLRSRNWLCFLLHRLRHQRERAELRPPPLKQLHAFPLGLLQRPPFSHPLPFRVHLALPPLLHLLLLLLLPQHLVRHLLLLLLTVALLFSHSLVRGRPSSWIRVPPLRIHLPRFPSLKMCTWYNSCSIAISQEVPSRHIRASKSSLLRFVCFLLAFI